MLKKSSLSEKDHGKWMSVLVPEFMSSEDSDSELVQSSNIRSNGDQPGQMSFSRLWIL